MKFDNGLKLTTTSLAVLLLSAAAFGQEQATAPPPNALGEQVEEKFDVVYPTPREVVQETVNEALEMQLTPDEIKTIKEQRLARERETATPYTSIAKSVTRTIFVDLSSGATPPAIRLTKGQQSSIVFTDTSGNPWLIERVSFNRELFSDGRGEEKDSKPTNILTLESNRAVAYGNVTVTLRGLHIPVIFILTTDQPEVDLRIDAKIDGSNPDAPAAVITGSGLPEIDADLGSFLDGVPPPQAARLKVTGIPETEAWRHNGFLYVRTKAGDPLYPAYIAGTRATSGASALAVYKFTADATAITFSNNGSINTAFFGE